MFPFPFWTSETNLHYVQSSDDGFPTVVWDNTSID